MLLAGLLALAAVTVAAEGDPAGPALAAGASRSAPEDLRYRFEVDLPTTVAATAWAIRGHAWLAGSSDPLVCRWCENRGLFARIDGEHGRRPPWPGGTAAASSYSWGALAVAVGVGVAGTYDDNSQEWGRNFGNLAESMSLTAAVLQSAKVIARRKRPDAHDPHWSTPKPDDNKAFFSGHAALAFGSAVAAGTIASTRDYHRAGAVWAVGLTSATATAYLRVAARKHHPTDVLVGAAVGGFSGWLIPHLNRRPRASESRLPAAVAGGQRQGVLATPIAIQQSARGAILLGVGRRSVQLSWLW